MVVCCSVGFTEETLPTPRELLSHSSLDIQNSGGDDDTSDEREIHIIVSQSSSSAVGHSLFLFFFVLSLSLSLPCCVARVLYIPQSLHQEGQGARHCSCSSSFGSEHDAVRKSG